MQQNKAKHKNTNYVTLVKGNIIFPKYDFYALCHTWKFRNFFSILSTTKTNEDCCAEKLFIPKQPFFKNAENSISANNVAKLILSSVYEIYQVYK